MRSKNYSYFRNPKTTQERRANQDRKYVRGKRLPNSLPNGWDDLCYSYTNSWKDKRKTQYRAGKRGKKHTIVIKASWHVSWQLGWKIAEYMEKHNISYTFDRSKIYSDTTIINYWTNKDIGLEYLIPHGKEDLFSIR